MQVFPSAPQNQQKVHNEGQVRNYRAKHGYLSKVLLPYKVQFKNKVSRQRQWKDFPKEQEREKISQEPQHLMEAPSPLHQCPILLLSTLSWERLRLRMPLPLHHSVCVVCERGPTSGQESNFSSRFKGTESLTSEAQLVGHHPAKWKVTGSIPGQGTHLGFGFGLWSGCAWEATNRCFSLNNLFSPFFPLLSPLS